MPYDQGPLGYPVKPWEVGKPALQAASEAMERQAQHAKWHEDHPGDFACPPALTGPNDYADIERGDDMWNFGGAGTFEAGDSIVPRK